MGTRRAVYNLVLGRIKSRKEKSKNFNTLRDKYVTEKNLPKRKKWMINTPKEIRAGAVRDLIKNFKVCFEQLKQGIINKFSMKFCSKKDNPAIEIPLSAITSTTHKIKKTEEQIKNSKKKVSKEKNVNEEKKRVVVNKEKPIIYIYKTIMSKKLGKKDAGIKIKKKDLRKPIVIDSDCRMKVENGAWYLYCPYIVEKKLQDPNKKEICALDPGIRKFQYIYSQEESIGVKINKTKIRELLVKIDKNRQLKSLKKITSSSYKKKERRLQRRLSNLIDEMHYKTCSYLTKNYKTIILPPFETKEVSSFLSKKTNRSLFSLKHFRFRKRLEAKAKINDCLYVSITEEFTSQTCSECGFLTKDNNELHICKNCGFTVDRDENGARNIFIKYLSSRT